MEVTNEESIEGKLGLEPDQLKGAVSLSVKADVKMKAEFEGMNSKFDLVMNELLFGDPGNGAPKGVPPGYSENHP